MYIIGIIHTVVVASCQDHIACMVFIYCNKFVIETKYNISHKDVIIFSWKFLQLNGGNVAVIGRFNVYSIVSLVWMP